MPDNNGQQNDIATALTEVSERLAALVKDEIDLAKAEMTDKVKSLRNGIIAGVLVGVFGFFALIVGLGTLAWGLNSLFGSLWLGYLATLGILVVLMVVIGLYAFRKLKVGAPQPTMAIDEAKKIRATLTAKSEGTA